MRQFKSLSSDIHSIDIIGVRIMSYINVASAIHSVIKYIKLTHYRSDSFLSLYKHIDFYTHTHKHKPENMDLFLFDTNFRKNIIKRIY